MEEKLLSVCTNDFGCATKVFELGRNWKIWLKMS